LTAKWLTRQKKNREKLLKILLIIILTFGMKTINAMNNYKLIIQYDGTHYAGWQIQSNADTIQARIANGIKSILREDINLIGSGRTDTGVHALGQSANFKTMHELDLYRFKYSLNSILPYDISIIKIEKAKEDFHARFDAKRRSYIYLITKDKLPFYFRYAYYYKGKIDIQRLNSLSRFFLGEFIFTSFAKKNTETENKNCVVYHAHWKQTQNLFLFYIEADRYLHGMVRTIIGTLLNASKNNFKEDYLAEVFNAHDRQAASEAVPAKGLFLYKVKY
jgi:tRNA pseudouridine38-40 synthase